MHSTNKWLAPPWKSQKKDKTTFILTTLAELAVESFFEHHLHTATSEDFAVLYQWTGAKKYLFHTICLHVRSLCKVTSAC